MRTTKFNRRRNSHVHHKEVGCLKDKANYEICTQYIHLIPGYAIPYNAYAKQGT